MIDLRSDTVTRPTPEMRRVIADAEVGDDVYHDDPSVLALEERVAEILGKQDAVYMPTGTMTNQIALKLHTRPGDVVLAAEGAHIGLHEVGGPAAHSGLTLRALPTRRGTFTADDVRRALPDPPPGLPTWLFEPVSLVEVENTHNEAGGTVWPVDQIRDVAEAASQAGIAAHLDGARLWNAAAASGIPEHDFAAGFTTVSVCFSKGLGAPMGSALAGARGVVTEARRFKQMFGGGFRQAGMMAAGARYALDHHRERLTEDHVNAFRLASGLAETAGIRVDLDSVETNMVYFELESREAAPFVAQCREAGLALNAVGHRRIRAVTHLGIDAADIDAALVIIAAGLE